MSPKSVLRMEFFTAITMSVFFGLWLFWSLERWSNGDFTLMWAIGTVVIIGVLAIDVWRVLKKLS
jgi:hypothetical protein